MVASYFLLSFFSSFVFGFKHKNNNNHGGREPTNWHVTLDTPAAAPRYRRRCSICSSSRMGDATADVSTSLHVAIVPPRRRVDSHPSTTPLQRRVRLNARAALDQSDIGRGEW